MKITDREVIGIIEQVGGNENILSVTHCITRLRFALKEQRKVNIENLEKNPLVKGSFLANGQFQVIIGPGLVDKVYKRLSEITGAKQMSKDDKKNLAEKDLNILQKAIKILGDIFIPILPAIVSAGLLLGLNNILVGKDVVFVGKSIIEVYPQWRGFSEIVNLIAGTTFVFLPGLVGWSAVTRLGGTPLLGIVMGLMLIHPSLMSANAALRQATMPQWNLFGLGVSKIGYQGQVLPVLIAAYLLVKVEDYLKRKIPEAFQLLLVAPITLLITGFTVFTIIGPVSMVIGKFITDSVVNLFHTYGPAAGAIYSGINALLVVTGMHHTFIALDLQLIAAVGMTYLWPVRVMSNISQGAAAFAMMYTQKDKKFKSLCATSAISAFLGVTEPAMFGVNIRYKYPFVISMIGAALGGFVVALNRIEGTIGIGGLPAFLNISSKFWGSYFTAMGITIISTFTLTIIYAKYKGRTLEVEVKEEEDSKIINQLSEDVQNA